MCMSACEKSTDALAKTKGYDDDHESWNKIQGIKKHRFYFLKQKNVTSEGKMGSEKPTVFWPTAI